MPKITIMEDTILNNVSYQIAKQTAVNNCLSNDYCTGFHLMRKKNSNDWKISYTQSAYTIKD